MEERVRGILASEEGITEKKMFGGLCFLHRGNMVCGIDNKNRLMVRVGPKQYEAALKSGDAQEMDFTGRPLKGMVYIKPEGVKTQAALSEWIEAGLRFTRTLPKK